MTCMALHSMARRRAFFPRKYKLTPAANKSASSANPKNKKNRMNGSLNKSLFEKGDGAASVIQVDHQTSNGVRTIPPAPKSIASKPITLGQLGLWTGGSTTTGAVGGASGNATGEAIDEVVGEVGGGGAGADASGSCWSSGAFNGFVSLIMIWRTHRRRPVPYRCERRYADPQRRDASSKHRPDDSVGPWSDQ